MRTKWDEIEKKEDEDYYSELKSVDPKGEGFKIKCPDCNAVAWVKLPEKRYSLKPISIACPAACGAYYQLISFHPYPTSKFDTAHFDLKLKCERDETEFALNGVLFRCPTCGIENPREIMKNLTNRVKLGCADTPSREVLSNFLSEIVATFDGVMRKCNKIAVENSKINGGDIHPEVRSFQNISAARNKLVQVFDMSIFVVDWSEYVKIFQKRHLFAHSLGVVDAEYIAKSGDVSSEIGKQVSLSPDEIVYLAQNAEIIVVKYFGYFLS